MTKVHFRGTPEKLVVVVAGKAYIACQTCSSGRGRETVGLVCQECGTDWGADWAIEETP